MSDLDVLIDAVEAGDSPTAMMVNQAIQCGFDGLRIDQVRAATSGSLDAAKRLQDALLPGWTLNSLHQERYPDNGMGPTGVWTCLLFVALPTRFVHQEAKASNAGRAWLLCILRAMKAMEAGG